MCSYTITFPNDSDEYDRLEISVNSIVNVQVYAIITQTFSSDVRVETLLMPDEPLGIQYPYEVYITVMV